MIEQLKYIEKNEIIGILKDPKNFTSKNVDYHPPLVERIWAPYMDGRLYFHYIHPCETSQALYHPHPWPSAMHIVNGTYEMGLGFVQSKITQCKKYGIKCIEEEKNFFCDKCGGKICDNTKPIITEISKLILGVDSYYEMLVPESWHYVRPINGIAKSVMLTDKKFPFSRENFNIRAEKPLLELPIEKAEEIRKWFLLYYETLK